MILVTFHKDLERHRKRDNQRPHSNKDSFNAVVADLMINIKRRQYDSEINSFPKRHRASHCGSLKTFFFYTLSVFKTCFNILICLLNTTILVTELFSIIWSIMNIVEFYASNIVTYNVLFNYIFETVFFIIRLKEFTLLHRLCFEAWYMTNFKIKHNLEKE